MRANPILWPLVAQVALTAAVWVALYVQRLGEIRARRLDPEALKDSRRAAGVLEHVAAADNFRTLFEVPVLFFAAGLAIAALGRPSAWELGLAWAYVALRAVHSAIHVGYNRVLHRFAAYALSTLVVFALWALIALDLAAAG